MASGDIVLTYLPLILITARRFSVIIRELLQSRQDTALRLGHNERFRDFTENAADYYWESDSENRFTYVAGNTQFMVTNLSA